MVFRRSTRPHTIAFLLVLLLLAGCSDPLGPAGTSYEITVLSGDGQLTTPGEALTEPLTVIVRRVQTGEPAPDVNVRWDVTSGEGVVLDRATTVTDSTGRASVHARLGSELGAYVIVADLDRRVGEPSRFELLAVERPRIGTMPQGALAGDTIRIEGTGFRPDFRDNIVLFSGIRGEVVEGGEDALMVHVPACFPTRSVDVAVWLGPSVWSASAALQVSEQGAGLRLEAGEAIVIQDPTALSCLKLPEHGSARYLAVPHSAATQLGTVYAFGMFGVSGEGPLTFFSAPAVAASPEGFLAQGEIGSGLPQARWDGAIRRLERELLPLRSSEIVRPSDTPTLSISPAPPPSIGDRRVFNVLNREQTFEEVTAEVVHVSARAILYQDTTAPADGFTDSDFAAFAGDFEDVVFPAVTEVFGQPSDIDANDRIIILFTSQVNRLTAAGSNGFIGGFFYGLDLLPDRTGSNGGEIFYALVPDPQGELGEPRSKELVLRSIPAILAHEFQHMVHFNERVLVREVPTTEALWLSEGLAQMAEDVVSEVFEARGETQVAEGYRLGNIQRARRYLGDPGAVSLIPITGGGTLEERGAGWLFLRYLRGQASGGNALLRALTQTRRTGVSNVLAETGRNWEELLSSWSAALHLDGLGLPVDPRFAFADIDLRETLTQGGNYPLSPLELGPEDFWASRSLRPSSPAFYIIRPGTGGTALTIAGPSGLPTPAAHGLQLTLVRVQ
ncbi:MAG: hypothetical protein WDZ89_03410 [Gemmatimonadota bacterium]